MAKVTFIGTAPSYTVQGVVFRPRKGQFVAPALAKYLEDNEQFVVDMNGLPEADVTEAELEEGVRTEEDPAIPDYPSSGFDSKDAAIAWAKDKLDVDLSGEKNRALKTINSMVAEAYRIKFFPDAPGENDDSVEI